jgi:hypothetical protein
VGAGSWREWGEGEGSTILASTIEYSGAWSLCVYGRFFYIYLPWKFPEGKKMVNITHWNTDIPISKTGFF